MERIKKWFAELFYIVRNYRDNQIRLQRQTGYALELIRKRTTVHADVHMRDTYDQIIVIGQYRNRDYVRVFSVKPDDLLHLVGILKSMEAALGRIDVVHSADAVIKDVFSRY